jgi:mono/diheme cytochrome c family protein
MTRTRSAVLQTLLVAVVAVGLGAAWVAWRNSTGGFDDTAAQLTTAPATPEQIAKGAYLARAGNCMACHTARGGERYAGGRGIETPFGTLYSSNLTPDANTGLGRWTPNDFWKALHHGSSKDGRWLYPAFPYTSYTGVTRGDADALFAYLSSLPPVTQTTKAHALRWPFSTQAALGVWRALYFSPGTSVNKADAGPQRNRGAYLVQTLGHCSSCHGTRNALGAVDSARAFSGGLMPDQTWYAPSLLDTGQASVADWPIQDIVALLKTGVSPQASVSGPMAEVVQHSTQHMNDADLQAMAVYLKDLPTDSNSPRITSALAVSVRVAERGAKIYEQHCANCHSQQGEGVVNAYPNLAGNRAVTLAEPTNLVQVVLYGGFAPATTGNPRPYGMPPFVLQLNNADIAAVLTHIRRSWGNNAAPVTELEVNRLRQ